MSRARSDVPRVAVIGGGVSGLASAFYLARAGVAVSLFESADEPGGLASTFQFDGVNYDRFYHVMLPSDGSLLELLGDLALGEDVYWQKTALGFVHGRRAYDLETPLDLLRFKPVPLVDRLRLGLTALYAAHFARPGNLDNVLLVDWLKRLSGKRAFEKLWRPLLEAKFGEAHDRIPALWYHASFNREKGTGEEVKGYVVGGYHRIMRTLIAALEELGVVLTMGTGIRSLDLNPAGKPVLVMDGRSETFDAVVVATPFPIIARLMQGPSVAPYADSLESDLDYQGVLNVLVMLRQQATEHYWLPVVDSEVPFRGIVETTHVLDLSDTGGHHLVYLLNYVHRSDELFQRDPRKIESEYVGAFLGLVPGISNRDVVASFCFKRPYVEPIWTRGFGQRRPPLELVPGRIFLATTAHVYPQVTSWNSSIGVAREAVAALLKAMGL